MQNWQTIMLHYIVNKVVTQTHLAVLESVLSTILFSYLEMYSSLFVNPKAT